MKTSRILPLFAFLLVLASCSSTRVRSDYDARADFRALRTYTWIDADLSRSAYPGIQSPLVKERIHSAVDGELASRGFRRITSGTPDFRIAFQIVVDNQVEGSRVYSQNSRETRELYGEGEESSGFIDVRSANGSRSVAYVASALAPSMSLQLVGRYGHWSNGRHYRAGGYYIRPYSFRYRYGYPRYRRWGHYGLYGHGYGGYGYDDGSTPHIRSTLVLDVYDGIQARLLWRGWVSKDLPEEPKPDDVQKYVREAVREILKEFPPES